MKYTQKQLETARSILAHLKHLESLPYGLIGVIKGHLDDTYQGTAKERLGGIAAAIAAYEERTK